MPYRLWELLYPLLRWLGLALLILLFAQALPFDLLAVVFAGDVLTYLEVVAALWLAAQVTRVRWAVAYARFILPRTIRRARARARRSARRVMRARPSSTDDDRPAAAFAFA